MIGKFLSPLLRLRAFAGASFRDHLSHRVRLFVRFIMCVMFMYVFVEFWRLIIREGLLTTDIPVTDLCWYASITQMMLFLSSRLFMVIEDDVRSGDIAYFLMRPVSYTALRISEGLGSMSANAALYYTAGIAALYFYIGALPSGGWPALLSALFLLYLGSILHLVFQTIAGLTALWLNDAESIYRIYQKLLIVLGGLYMPILFYPEWLQRIAELTPYYVMMYLPASMLLGATEPMPLIEAVGLVGLWMVIAMSLLSFVFRFCVRRLEINGG
ncbi:MAG: ABC transporter permease [Pseudobdellovibrionaceae bacterium]